MEKPFLRVPSIPSAHPRGKLKALPSSNPFFDLKGEALDVPLVPETGPLKGPSLKADLKGPCLTLKKTHQPVQTPLQGDIPWRLKESEGLPLTIEKRKGHPKGRQGKGLVELPSKGRGTGKGV